jgi:hypothetical protein
MVMVSNFTNDDARWRTSLRGIVNHGMHERYHHDVVGGTRVLMRPPEFLKAKSRQFFVDTLAKATSRCARKYLVALSVNKNV